MNAKRIVRELDNAWEFPYKALRAAIANIDAVVPELIKVLQQMTRNFKRFTHQNTVLHWHALVLLGYSRSAQAFPHVVEFCRQHGPAIEDAMGDFVFETLEKVLAGVAGRDIAPLAALYADEDAHESMRGAAIHAIKLAYLHNDVPRDECLAFCRQQFANLPRQPSHIWNLLLSATFSMHLHELMDDARDVFDEDLSDPIYINLGNLESGFATDAEEFLQGQRELRYQKLISDPITELEEWDLYE